MQHEFDDPALKAALKQAWGAETAPPALRSRVERALAVEAAKVRPASRGQFDWRRSPLVGLAAAALIVISSGLVFNYYRNAEPAFVLTLPNDIAGDMTAAHDRALAQAAHHQLAVPKEDLAKVRQTLKDRLGHPVLVASLGPEWKFEGASIAKVGQRDAAQMIYTKGNETVSVISVMIPPGAYYTPQEGTDYTQTFNGHPMAGVVKGGAIHCIIGSSNSQLNEKMLNRLRDKVRDLIAHDTSRGSGCAERAQASLGI